MIWPLRGNPNIFCVNVIKLELAISELYSHRADGDNPTVSRRDECQGCVFINGRVCPLSSRRLFARGRRMEMSKTMRREGSAGKTPKSEWGSMFRLEDNGSTKDSKRFCNKKMVRWGPAWDWCLNENPSKALMCKIITEVAADKHSAYCSSHLSNLGRFIPPQVASGTPSSLACPVRILLQYSARIGSRHPAFCGCLCRAFCEKSSARR